MHWERERAATLGTGQAGVITWLKQPSRVLWKIQQAADRLQSMTGNTSARNAREPGVFALLSGKLRSKLHRAVTLHRTTPSAPNDTNQVHSGNNAID